MQAPASVSLTVHASRGYQWVCCGVVVLATIFIANYAINSAARGLFGLQSAVFSVLTLLCGAWLILGAFKASRGQLRYSQGAWLWKSEQTPAHIDEIEGTLQLALDLQNYVLVQFVPQHLLQRPQFFTSNTPWLHLQAPHTDSASWLAFRRALLHSQGARHEELAG